MALKAGVDDFSSSRLIPKNWPRDCRGLLLRSGCFAARSLSVSTHRAGETRRLANYYTAIGVKKVQLNYPELSFNPSVSEAQVKALTSFCSSCGILSGGKTKSTQPAA